MSVTVELGNGVGEFLRNAERKKDKVKAMKNGQSALLMIFKNYLEVYNSENSAAD